MSKTFYYGGAIDLHGVRHEEVDRMVENFILTNQDKFPKMIICGNSVKMINLAIQTIERIGCEYMMLKFGIITVQKFT